DHQAAENVTIQIKSAKKATISDEEGGFILRNLPPGMYELEISLTGYNTLAKQVQVEAGKTTETSFQLQLSDKELQEVVVKTGIRSYKTNEVSPSLRLQTPILEAPQNIQVISGKVLADQQIISMSDGVLRNVSGAVRVEHWGDLYTNVSSRGSQVQAFRNGFNVVNSYWGPLTEDMSFVDHIEFVKGPAGFMLANGDPSGLYNVVTKKPTGQTKGELNLTMGSFDLYRAALDLDGKLRKDGKLLYRLNLSAQEKNSFRANEFNNRYAVAPVISYQVDDKTKLTLEYNYQRANMSDVGSYYVFSTAGYATLPVNFTSLPAGLPATNINDHSVYLNLRHQINANWQLTGQLAYFNYKQQGSSMWPSVVNPDGTMIRAASSWDAKSSMKMGQFFLNGDLTTDNIHHRLLVGLDVANKSYFADWSQYHQLDSVGAAFNTYNPNYGVPVNGYPHFNFSTPIEQRAEASGGLMSQRYSGLYLQDELGFWHNKLRLTLAGRYTYVTQSEWGGADYSAKHITPRIGLSYSIDKHSSIYALYDQAFIPQSGRLADGGKVRPITGSNIEFGIKKDWGGGNWNTTLALYRILKEHELTADPNSAPTSGISIELGQKRSQGIEFDLRGRIANGLNLIVNYAYTDSKVTKVAPGVTSVKVGDDVPAYVKHTANAWLNYKIQEGSLKGLGFSTGATFLSGRNTWWDPSPDPAQQLPDYVKLDAGIFWEKDKLNVTLNMFNVLNTYLYSGSYYAYLHAYYWQADPPRNLRVSISYKF
ncbi:MAG TPA: TonB-dependent receptor, partial [Sediminibacterium sp.]|nr:TonB-dependent receptor [Sediminibacterium sp.]